MIICKCVDELHRTNKERESDEERDAAKGIVEKLVSEQHVPFERYLILFSDMQQGLTCLVSFSYLHVRVST